MLKKAGILVAICILLFSFGSIPTMAEESSPEPDFLPTDLILLIYFGQRTDMSFSYLGRLSFDNIPLEVRNVPIHGDDLWYVPSDNQGPIANDRISLPSVVTFSLTFIDQHIETGTNTVSYGLKGRWFWKNWWSNSTFAGGNINERNYTNAIGTDERGTGAALTYYAIDVCGLIANPRFGGGILNVSPELFFNFETKDHLLFSCSATTFSLWAENGWDRYGGLEIYKTYKLADIIAITPLIGIKFEDQNFENGYWGINLGTELLIMVPTDLGKQVTKDCSLNIFLELTWKF